jgi:hypothetical protein
LTIRAASRNQVHPAEALADFHPTSAAIACFGKPPRIQMFLTGRQKQVALLDTIFLMKETLRSAQ